MSVHDKPAPAVNGFDQWLGFMALLVLALTGSRVAEAGTYCVKLTVTSDLPFAKVPMDPTIDFGAMIRKAGLPGVLNPNSIVVVDLATGKRVDHATTEDFVYGDKGRVEWVIEDPAHKTYEIRFQTIEKRPPLAPVDFTPMIGVGDLLRYNAGQPRPVVASYLSGLVDLTGDGKRDLVGCWNYAYRPGWPWDGVVCYPRVGSADRFEFGDLIRIRYVDEARSSDFKHFSRIYMHADMADLNGDGRVDLVYSPSGGDQIHLYVNSGRRDAGGMPVFVASGSLSRQTTTWGPCRAVDLNQDGAVDFVLGDLYLKNTNAKGWPIQFDKGVALGVGEQPCFLDVNGDGRLDAVGLGKGPCGDVHEYVLEWRENLGGDPPAFGPQRRIPDINVWWPTYVAAVNEGPRRGLLVLHDVYSVVSFCELGRDANGEPCFKRFGRATSKSAVLAMSDQAWPCVCDWDGDGDWDLLIGGGYGWPRIVINNGTSRRPAFAEPQLIYAEGKPIRVLRDEILGGKHWHNMGYPYPAFVDWDHDGLGDLMLPNETNRIFWYKNVGTKTLPRFGKRSQVLCDGYPDTPEHRARSAKLAGDKDVPNNPYPYEKDRPFFWRTGVGFGDLNGDGLTDLVTHDGQVRKLTLFTRYRDSAGALRLKKDRPLTLADGRQIDDAIVQRSAHWTESFRCADWDGDGLVDVVYSCAGTEASKGSVYLLRNCGTKTDPKFENPVTLCCFGVPIKVTAHGPQPAVADMDGDGKPDVLTCVEWSVYPFYSHAAIEMKQRPTFELGEVRALGR
ncbi:MAG: VCBS repeat-containing protein [Phycisphaerae bacterium]|nr:VCBS repeat-containing protein [Phycisphaerae bacterium]